MRNYVEAEHIELIYSGSNFFETLDRIVDESRFELHLQTYIFECDETGLRVLHALERAAQRGVKVFLLVDAYASPTFPRHVREFLKKAGVNYRFFSPFLTHESVFFARRLHHKIVVADRQIGLIGGINIANKYNTRFGNYAWLDYAALIEGEVCEYLHRLCDQFYLRIKPRMFRAWEHSAAPALAKNRDRYVRFRRNDWIQRRNEIHKSYVEALIKAESKVVIVASYFLPGQHFRRLLREASTRGVEITVILAGRSDTNTVRLAENYLYDFYLRYNIKLYEWSNSVMHGKAMIVDNTWATIGSYNLNFLSHYVSIELNADIIDKEFIHTFAQHLEDITHNACLAIPLDKHRKSRNFIMQFLRWSAYNIIRMLQNIALWGSRYRMRPGKKRKRQSKD